MSEMTVDQRVLVSILLILLGTVFCIAHVVRSIKLGIGVQPRAHKLYTTFLVIPVLGVLALWDAVDSEGLTALLGGIVGYMLGGEGEKEKQKEKEKQNGGKEDQEASAP